MTTQVDQFLNNLVLTYLIGPTSDIAIQLDRI